MHASLSELHARSLARALEANPTVWILPDGSWAVESQSTPGLAHRVHLSQKGLPICRCLGFLYRTTCIHIAAVEWVYRHARLPSRTSEPILL